MYWLMGLGYGLTCICLPGEEAIKAKNVFYYLTYVGAVRLEAIEDQQLRRVSMCGCICVGMDMCRCGFGYGKVYYMFTCRLLLITVE